MMMKVFRILLVLLFVGGIAYAFKAGVLHTGKDKEEKATLASVGQVSRQGSLGQRQGESGSKKGKKKKGRRGKRVSVEAATVKVGSVRETLNYVGSLLPNTSVEVYSKVEGRLQNISVDVGSRVKEGRLIARIEQEEIIEEVRETEASLRVAQATLKGKEAEMKNLERQLERSRRLFKKNFISRQELDSVETRHYSAVAQTELAKAQVAQREAVLQNMRIRLRNTEIHSPITGYVGKKLLDRGAMVKTNTPIASLVQLDPVMTLISVTEKDYHKMKAGLPAVVRVDAYPGRTFSGKIARVSPVLDKDTRTADVEIEIPNSKKELKPGMFARVEIVAQKRHGALLVPEGALVKVSEGHGVFKLRGKGSDSTSSRQATSAGSGQATVKLVSVKTGLSHKGWVEVQGPLKTGDRVVTLGSSLLRDGQRVKVIEAPLGAGAKGDEA